MPALISALVLAAALGGHNPVFDDAVARYQEGTPQEAVPLLQSLLGAADLSDGDRAEVQIWLAACYATLGDDVRMQAHLQRAVALDPNVMAPVGVPAKLATELQALQPKPPVPWGESPQGVLLTSAAGVSAVAILLAGLVAIDMVVTDQWLADWYGTLDDSAASADPRSYADFVGVQNKRYARVRENRRADVAVLAGSGLIVLGAGALALAAVFAPGGEE